MKKKIIAIMLFIILVFTNCAVFADTEEPELTAQGVILIDTNTEKILYEKNADEKLYPASTTKIMTAIITLENSKLTDEVTVSYDAVMSVPEGYSKADLQIGETLTVEELLQVLLVHSANDAANVLAEYVGGSEESFVSMMNTKAHDLNLDNTHFTNAYGKHDENHYTSARDLAKLMKYCIKNEEFRKISGSASCAIPATNLHSERIYTNTNELLLPNSRNYLSYVTTGKTGYTSQAQDCLVSSAYQNDMELIGVVLGADSNTTSRFQETRKLYKYGYDNYSIKTIIMQGTTIENIEVQNGTQDTKSLDLNCKQDIKALLKNDINLDEFQPEITLNKDIKAPIYEGDELGTIKYVIGDETYETKLIASHDVEKSMVLTYCLWTMGIGLVVAIIIIKIREHK